MSIEKKRLLRLPNPNKSLVVAPAVDKKLTDFELRILGEKLYEGSCVQENRARITSN